MRLSITRYQFIIL